MKSLFVRRLVNPCGWIVDASTKVFHMTEDMPLAVLRHGPAEIGSDTKKGCRGLLDRITFDRKPADDDKTPALQQDIVANPCEGPAKLGELKVVAVNGTVSDPAFPERIEGGIDLGSFRVGK